MMYARVLIGTACPTEVTALSQMLDGAVRETALAQPGNRGFVALVDQGNGKAMVMTFWNTAEDLAECEARGAVRSQLAGIAQYLDGPVICETYTVVSDSEDLPGARRGDRERTPSPAAS
jgi:hypothetical protein